jgi:hypothetical protein
MSFNPIPNVTDEQIRQMAREAEAENLLLPPTDRKPRGYHYRRAAIRLGLMPLADMSADELAWQLAVVMGRVRGE